MSTPETLTEAERAVVSLWKAPGGCVHSCRMGIHRTMGTPVPYPRCKSSFAGIGWTAVPKGSVVTCSRCRDFTRHDVREEARTND